MNHSLAILTVVLCFLFVQIAGAADQPNILFIMADDLRAYGGSYTKEVVRTPHLDRLASRGMTFELACAQYPVCNPSRTSLLTGLRCEQTDIVGNQEFFRERLPDVVTLPQLLRQSGWKTYSYGKILHTANTGENQRATWLDLGKSWDEAETTQPTASGAKGDIRNLTGGKLPWCEIGIIDGPEEEQPDALTATAAIHKMRS